MDFDLATGGVISSLLLLVGHYFPWHKLFNEPLSRIQSYTYGSGACWTGFAYWRWFGGGDYLTPLGLMIIYIIAGGTVWAAYRLDKRGQALTITNRVKKGNNEPVER